MVLLGWQLEVGTGSGKQAAVAVAAVVFAIGFGEFEATELESHMPR